MTDSSSRTSFVPANKLVGHLAVHPVDAKLNPPATYLYVQDGLIVLCGTFWILAYVFYIIRCHRDNRAGLPLHSIYSNIAWEIYYGIVIPTNAFEHITFMGFALVDLGFCLTIARNERGKRGVHILKTLVLSTVVHSFLYRALTRYVFFDSHKAAYWTAMEHNNRLTWASVLEIVGGHTRAYSLEIWTMRFLGSSSGWAVFFWRFWNVPQNWEYVGSWLSVVGLAIWLLGELVYPVLYIRIRMRKLKDA